MPKEKTFEEQFDEDFEDSFAGGDIYNWEKAKPIKQFFLDYLKELKRDCVGRESICSDCGQGYTHCHCAGYSDGYNTKNIQVKNSFDKRRI